jgi:hypothetical protein
MSITDSSEKINPVRNREGSQRPSISKGVKQFIDSDKGKDILIVTIIILVALASFLLGRMSKDGPKGELRVEYGENSQNSSETSLSPDTIEASAISANFDKNFFASKRGKKYYSISCSAGKTIKEQNRIYFKTGEEAEAAGFVLSSACR